jgi:hypothetical protein
MAYAGYLIKVGNYTIPLSAIRAETYTVTKNEQDLDSYTDMNGYIHRTALEHYVMKVEFELTPLISDRDFANLMANIRSQYIDSTEKSANVTYYVPELDTYVTQKSYVPSISAPIYLADANKIQYNQIRLAFIGY